VIKLPNSAVSGPCSFLDRSFKLGGFGTRTLIGTSATSTIGTPKSDRLGTSNGSNGSPEHSVMILKLCSRNAMTGE
jgi:hypothetical protein